MLGKYSVMFPPFAVFLEKIHRLMAEPELQYTFKGRRAGRTCT